MDINNLVNLIKIGILGKPNVGKSTFINKILKKDVSITNKKPQTTRNKITFLYQYNESSYFEFYDTPGYHQPKYELDEYLNKFVLSAIKEIDVVFLLIDLSRPIDDEDIEIISKIKNKNIFLIFNKLDLNNDYQNHLDKITNFIKPINIYFLSALSNNNIDNILFDVNDFSINTIKNIVIKDSLNNNENDKFITSEIIRNECLNLLKNEIPYGIAILVETFKYDQNKKLLTINADIVVERESHKSIVIGFKGNMIKQIGSNSRAKLLEIYDCKIMLNLFVKVDKDWRNNLLKIKEFGYFN